MTTVAEPHGLPQSARDALDVLCRRYQVRRLDIFGSALTDNFDPVRSDLDFLVAFEDDIPLGGFRGRWFRFHEALTRLFGRDVDLVDDAALANPFFRRRVFETRRQVFPPL